MIKKADIPDFQDVPLITNQIDGMFIDLESEMDRVFESTEAIHLDTNMLRRIVHTHLSRSQESLTVLLSIIDANQRGNLDNVLVLTLALTT